MTITVWIHQNNDVTGCVNEKSKTVKFTYVLHTVYLIKIKVDKISSFQCFQIEKKNGYPRSVLNVKTSYYYLIISYAFQNILNKFNPKYQ